MKTLLIRYINALRPHAVLAGVLLAGAVFLGVLVVRGEDSWAKAVEKRVAKDRVVRPLDYMKTELWKAAWLEAALLLGLALTTPLWARRGPVDLPTEDRRPGFPQGEAEKVMPRLVFWLGLLLIVALGLGLRAPRMELSIYNDEEHTLRTYTRGAFPRLTLKSMLEYEQSEAGLPFKRDGWENTIWSTTNGPNHVFFSILSRASQSAWNFFQGRPEIYFRDGVFRIPSLVASLGMIVFLGLLIYRETGSGGGGWAAALLAATHPWLIRYGTEGRGYGLMLFFCVLLWWFALGALRRPSWGNWIGFALSQWAMLNAYIGSIYVPLVLNLTLLPLLLWPVWREFLGNPAGLLETWHWHRFTRWVAANFLSLALYLPMIMPLVPQYRAYFNTTHATVETPSNWLEDAVAYSLTGVPWRTPEGTDLPSVTQGVIEGGEPQMYVAVILLTLLAIFGTGLLVFRRNALAWLLPTFFLAPVIGYFHNTTGGRILYVWYLIFAVPGVLILATAGMTPRLWLRRLRPGLDWIQSAVPVLVAGWIAIESYLPQAWMLHDRPKEDMEAAVRLSGRPVDPTGQTRSQSIHLACWTNAPFYDPWAITVVGPETVEEVVAYALESGRELEMTFAHRPLIAHFMPEVLQMLEDPGLFHPATILPGLEEAQFDIHVSQLRHQLDPQRITRTYALSSKQAQALVDATLPEAEVPTMVREKLERRGISLPQEATLHYLPQSRALVIQQSWPAHIQFRKALAQVD